MKKFLALTSALILSMSCFVGCDDKDKSSNNNKTSISRSSVSTLEDAASGLYKAISVTVDEYLEYGWITDGASGIIISDEELTLVDYEADKFINTIKGYYADSDKYKWFCIVGKNEVSEVYVADDWDSDVIGTYPENIDANGKKLSEIKSELLLKRDLKNSASDVYYAILNFLTVNDISDKVLSSSGVLSFDTTNKMEKEFIDLIKEYKLHSGANTIAEYLEDRKCLVTYESGEIINVYVAEDWDSDVIGTYPEDLDTEGKKLSDFKN